MASRRLTAAKRASRSAKTTRLPAPMPALLVFDFDGVLTDNRVWVFANGDEAVACNRSDGMAFDIFRASKLRTLILSTERNKVVLARAAKLRCEVINAVHDKAVSLRKFCEDAGVSLDRVMFVGNDMNDLPALRIVGWPVCPSDSHSEVLRFCRVKLKTAGGAGVAREIAERVLGLRFTEHTLSAQPGTTPESLS